MSEVGLGLGDFIIAPRTEQTERGRQEPMEQKPTTSPATIPAAEMGETKILPGLSEQARREKATTRAIVREDARLALKNLKRTKEREAKFYVNVALDYDTKARLKKAAHENDINMTIIMQTAIDTYLKDNGY
ncbi:hypothetical protein PH547_20930 [Rhizobium sp. CNPSo 3464]|uniref:hypothetical protein n=1 Tax=Rhizobium sp. CNPSo 3464 TaxID=3021406 RepID=UPI00254BFCEF|nr:hypothetical protein [Rhizobium sp. CNPSo 3464]MDK4741355.1 hypothetical protein [Rhizobium sp. CNPSo 3464]